MRIAYDNLLKTSTIVATNENSNYPATNLYNDWKRKIFKATTTSSNITVTFNEISYVTCVALDYNNLTSCVVNFYDSSDVLLDSWTFDTNLGTDAVYGSVSNVSYAIVVCSSTVDLEIGTIFIGDSIYTGIEANQDIPLSSTDSPIFSNDRQVSGRQGSVTRGGTITIPLLDSDERKEIEACFYECGLITPFFLDLWDSSHAHFEPVYCIFTSGFTTTHADGLDSITFSIQEVN